MMRRLFILMALLMGFAMPPAIGGVSLIYAVNPPDNSAPVTPYVHISAGQSWRSNTFDSMGSLGINPQIGATMTLALNNANFPSGVLPVGAGINLPATLTGIANYSSTMLGSYPAPASGQDTGSALSIGRTAQLTQQMLRARAHPGTALAPIIEFDMACPSSSWLSGPCGGLGPGSDSWTRMQTMVAAIESFTPATFPRKLLAAKFRSVGWTQGGSFVSPLDTNTVSEWTAMEAAYDALNLPGTDVAPLNFYIGIRGMNSEVATNTQVIPGILSFVRANANGRTWGTTTWYQWPYQIASNIHTDSYGTRRHGEMEGYAKYVVEDEGAGAYYPLWRPLTGGAITVSGQTITVPFARPSGSDFATGSLAWMSDPSDGISVAPQYGFHVKRSGTDLTVTPTISGMNVLLTISETISPGDVLEVSYCWYGPGGLTLGQAGVWGNLMMAGPASVLFPGKTINAWAWPFAENVTA